MSLNRPEELIEALRAGQMVILMDDEDRENEGDLVMAAECVRPEDINFMARYGRGLICLTLTKEHCEQLKLPLMASNSPTSHGTNFTVSIEAADGVTTGISAADRAVTVQRAVALDARPSDLVQPGHVFPLMAHPGGVLARAGHTEAGCDLARLAGYRPAAVIVEILNEDGTMARRPDLEAFAHEHDLKFGTIADLIHYRISNEKTVMRVAETPLQTEFGEFRLITYEDSIDKDLHMALVKGDIEPEKPTLVRVHIENPVADLTAAVSDQFGWPLRDVLKRIGEADAGVAVILCNQVQNNEIIRQVESLASYADEQVPVPRANIRDLRTIGLGAQILADVGVRKMRVLSAPKRIHAISGFNLEVVEYIHD
ncbi:3,4-dihydroxy 2-butanone 4-phosphate synthase/GTP cyclohydrolase II [Methylohalomonas lacus]|uniref:3,4-dihydroxy-2-butanone 4-phosphate synthase n=1 Tax=Methylohalomonas lacus TaxID=398773 RepID=A0AAE3L0N0_9GAMM|nr:bifunctional 3,4-dihydroxy-2-butanone-4-phosphate synthase/GTP cyclohydrolase II [Methylohalomonas lacus]MCS3902305.1 3,4-dihydroxy 2-butanone 4-phosphate synthase/GTP cyclohydrolase II [Methylohalomonas lacus]